MKSRRRLLVPVVSLAGGTLFGIAGAIFGIRSVLSNEYPELAVTVLMVVIFALILNVCVVIDFIRDLWEVEHEQETKSSQD
ncbi:hypothetical protein EDD70_2337 [Hydrogenoanaerobacterium saccharovorans]|uniref:Uncharacterized protein n=1 Tax=Hydrogenoanaerobacterium saccharovorans TaxID=474960 RepID=A0A1H8CY27_9FIRM|nr:hypothetical protein [Hydrogenoanaerobacterium saccharovorans]RPF43373.1 hypothetical protein EDD70_2337 [Hydrogenoanaerobacterium saccharovorans]SEM99782.1 hypothetical protein SAMN05216180_2395 [Hydrogenoanaerobacterium saccharovorans]